MSPDEQLAFIRMKKISFSRNKNSFCASFFGCGVFIAIFLMYCVSPTQKLFQEELFPKTFFLGERSDIF